MSWLSSQKYTLEEFWELPEPADHSKLELISGVLYMTPPPGYQHDYAVARLMRILTRFLDDTKTPGILFVPRAAIWTSPNTHLEPDLMYLSAETEAKLEANQRTVADLVVEVISPSTAIYDRNTKADAYARLGVKELWLIDETRQTFEVRRLVDGRLKHGDLLEQDDVVQSGVLSELQFSVAAVFE